MREGVGAQHSDLVGRRFDIGGQAFDRIAQFAGRSVVCIGEFKQHPDVVHQPRLIFSGVDRALQSRPLLQDFLRLLLIIPEIGRGGLVFQLFEVFSFGVYVKETSAVR